MARALGSAMTWNTQTDTALSALRGAFDFVTIGAMVVDPQMALLWANSAGRRILERDDGLRERDGCLTASTQAARRRLAAIMAQALGPDASAGCIGGVVPRPSGWLGYQVVVMPPDPGASPERFTALFVTDPARDLEEVEPCLMQMYGLTASEASVAGAVARGLDLSQVAEHRQVTRGTVRVQLRQVFEKVGVRRQVDLVRLVLGIAATRCGPTT